MDHKKLDFPHQLGKPDYPASLPHKRALSLDYLTPHRFTTSQPRAPGRRFALAQVLFVEGAISAGGTKMRPPRRDWGQKSSEAPRTRSAGGAASPRRCAPTPLAPSATRVSPPASFETSSLQLCLNYSHPIPFE